MKIPRAALCLAAAGFLAAGGSAFSQQQERTLLERIDRPDMTLGSPMQGKAFGGAGAAAVKGSAIVREFPGAGREANVGEFAGTRSFFGIKNPWFGNKVFAARESPLVNGSGFSSEGKTFPVREASAGEFASSGKQAQLGNPVQPVRPFAVRGEAQGALDGISDKIKKDMTIDEVRELLNKPR
jgi:hypothetical protein